MKVGETVMREIETWWEPHDRGRSPRRRIPGRVVYIHPEGRYHVVEFDVRGVKIRESYRGTEE